MNEGFLRPASELWEWCSLAAVIITGYAAGEPINQCYILYKWISVVRTFIR